MWLQAHLTVSSDQAPLIELLFDSLGALAVTLDDAGDDALLEPPLGTTPLWRQTRVSALFSAQQDAGSLRRAVGAALHAELSTKLSLEVLEERAWERTWLERFGPMRFGNRLWVCPRDQAIDDAEAVVVRLDPGLAFGTGTHPTTALCLAWLDTHDLAGKRMIDYGCGSGILAIAALRLGAAHVFAVDHDPQALLATRRNAVDNGVGDRLSLLSDRDPTPSPADLLVANILSSTLQTLAPRLAALVRPHGLIAVSGVLEAQAQAVADAYAPYFDMQIPTLKDDWALLEGRRKR